MCVAVAVVCGMLGGPVLVAFKPCAQLALVYSQVSLIIRNYCMHVSIFMLSGSAPGSHSQRRRGRCAEVFKGLLLLGATATMLVQHLGALGNAIFDIACWRTNESAGPMP